MVYLKEGRNMREKENINRIEEREKNLVEFLTLTKTGKFVSVEECSLPCARIEEETELIDANSEELFYYNLA